MYPHRGAMPQGPTNHVSRLNELMDELRSTVDAQNRVSEQYELQYAQQMQEMQLIKEKIYLIEQNHGQAKAKFEEEIQSLRRQLDAARAPPGAGPGQGPPHGGPGPAQQPPPPTIASGGGLFNNVMSGSGQAGLAPPPPQPSHGPPDHMGGPQQHHLTQAPPGPGGLPGPPPPHQSQQQQQPPPPPFQQPFPQATANGINSQPPQSTASPGPGRRGVGRPPAVGPATPQINTQIPYGGGGGGGGTGTTGQSPQVSHPTPDHSRVAPRPPPGNALGELDPEHLPAHCKKQGPDWYMVWNQHVPRMLDVDLLHTLDHNSVVCCVRFSHDGQYVATGCNRSAQIYDVATGEQKCILTDESADVTGDLYIRSVCFSPDGKYLATGAEDKLIRVWDIANRTIRNKFSGHEQDIYSLDFAQNGRTIASGSGDRTVRLWDIETGQNTLTLSIEDGVTTVAISPDAKYVAAGSLDKSVRVWDMVSGYLAERLEGPDGHKDSVYSVAFSPNGRDLVSGSLDKTIKMWELSSPRGSNGPKGGRCIKTFEGHRDFVLSVALTPDANWVLSGSKDRGVQFWDPRTGATQLMLQGHKNSVISVAPSPTGGYFATGSGDQKAKIWSYRPM
jgi:glucose repression regulatory protein TUP1